MLSSIEIPSAKIVLSVDVHYKQTNSNAEILEDFNPIKTTDFPEAH